MIEEPGQVEGSWPESWVPAGQYVEPKFGSVVAHKFLDGIGQLGGMQVW